MDHRTTHGEHCSCHSCAPASRWDIPASRGGNPGTPERAAFVAARLPDGAVRSLTEAWCKPSSRRRAPYAGEYGHLS